MPRRRCGKGRRKIQSAISLRVTIRRLSAGPRPIGRRFAARRIALKGMTRVFASCRGPAGDCALSCLGPKPLINRYIEVSIAPGSTLDDGNRFKIVRDRHDLFAVRGRTIAAGCEQANEVKFIPLSPGIVRASSATHALPGTPNAAAPASNLR